MRSCLFGHFIFPLIRIVFGLSGEFVPSLRTELLTHALPVSSMYVYRVCYYCLVCKMPSELAENATQGNHTHHK